MSSLRRLILWTAALAVALVGVMSVASPTRAYAAERSSVTGKLVIDNSPNPDSVYRFDVRSAGHGTDATGTIFLREGPYLTRLDATCLVVDKTGTATITAVVVNGTEFTIGLQSLYVVKAHHLAGFGYSPPHPPVDCSSTPPTPTFGSFTREAKAGHAKVRGADEDEEDDD